MNCRFSFRTGPQPLHTFTLYRCISNDTDSMKSMPSGGRTMSRWAVLPLDHNRLKSKISLGVGTGTVQRIKSVMLSVLSVVVATVSTTRSIAYQWVAAPTVVTSTGGLPSDDTDRPALLVISKPLFLHCAATSPQ